MASQSEYISVERQHAILVLTIARPDKKNALTPCMYRAISSALDDAQADEEIAVVLITNEGDFFCAGNDVGSFAGLADIPYQQRPGFNFMNTLAKFTKPVVAAVNGSAVGIGVTLLLHCDLVYASAETQLSFPFVTIGLVPEFGSTTLLPKRLGYQKAAEIFLLGKKISADEALELGLVNEIISGQQLFTDAQSHCQALCKQPREALMATKRLMKHGDLDTVLERIDEETQVINRLLPKLSGSRNQKLRFYSEVER